MNNSVFGKTIENVRKRQNVILLDDKQKAIKLASKPNFDFNKPIYVGQAILDLSKTLMFDFHYNYIRKKYGEKAELLFTDTDSLMYCIETDDVYHDSEPHAKKNV